MKELISSKSHMIGKLFIFQFASSLLGLFVVSPFKGSFLIFAGIFTMLFYLSLICYAVIEDGQKDCVSYKAGRLEKGSALTGFYYALISYIPTIVLVLVQMLMMLLTNADKLSGIKGILNAFIRFFLMGMYLGFDVGLAERAADPVTNQLVSTAPKSVAFMCDNYILFALFLVVMPLACGLSYYLAFIGKVHVDTSEKKKK